jgi:hypothetical protein
MRIHAKRALWLVLCLVAIPAAPAQQKQEASNGGYRNNLNLRQSTTEPIPLTLDDGLAVISAALDSPRHAAFRSDCSHFVHGLYQRAGFPFTYASSSDLYAGIDEFRRVANPQPGDLAVWRGHVGVVINPAQHSFFSLLHSGPGVEHYDSPYWKRRGHPRFFRYVKSAPERAPSGSFRTASLKPSKTEDPAFDVPASDAEQFSTSTDGASSIRLGEKANSSVPRVAVVNSLHPKPDQIAAAFLQACADSQQSLRQRDLFKSAQPLIIFDHFTVKKVHISGSQNWIDVQIDELISISSGKAQVQNRSDRQRWPLIRSSRGTWELTPPRDTIYLPQQIAAHIMAQQLAQLTRDADNTDRAQETELAQLLNVLLQK